jgi:hypothetical protein
VNLYPLVAADDRFPIISAGLARIGLRIDSGRGPSMLAGGMLAGGWRCLDLAPSAGYIVRMDDNVDLTHQMPSQEWVAALDRSDAGAAAGRTVPWSEARARLLAIVDQADPTDLEA